MAVTSVGSSPYAAYQLYQWQTATSSSSSASRAASILSAGVMNGSGMAGQISSMIELTRYAMEKMGLGADSRVTFSQISRYRDQLSESFNADLQKAMAGVGVQNVGNLTFNLDAAGRFTADGPDAADRKVAQAYLDAHPELGTQLIKAIEAEGGSVGQGGIDLQLQSDGRFALADERARLLQSLRASIREMGDLAERFRSGLSLADIDAGDTIRLGFDEDGDLVAYGDSENMEAINEWLDSQSDLEELLAEICRNAGADPQDVVFTLPASGDMDAGLDDDADDRLQAAVQKNLDAAAANAVENLLSGLIQRGHLAEGRDDLLMRFSADGRLTVADNAENAGEINAWLAGQAVSTATLRAQIEKAGVSLGNVTLALSPAGQMTASVSGQQSDNMELMSAVRSALIRNPSVGRDLLDGLKSLNIDPSINFSIQLQEDGKVRIIGTHADTAKVQKLFDEHPELVKAYGQIEALAGLEDARKAMQIPPSEMRRAIQIESIATAWWNDTGTESYFGSYSDGSGLSLLSGLNLKV